MWELHGDVCYLTAMLARHVLSIKGQGEHVSLSFLSFTLQYFRSHWNSMPVKKGFGIERIY